MPNTLTGARSSHGPVRTARIHSSNLCLSTSVSVARPRILGQTSTLSHTVVGSNADENEEVYVHILVPNPVTRELVLPVMFSCQQSHVSVAERPQIDYVAN